MSQPQQATNERDRALLDLYRERNFVTKDGHPQYLPVVCEHRTACWTDAQDRLPRATCAGEISPPWVGPRYDEGRVLVVLGNLNGYGGCDFGPDAKVGMRLLGAAARSGLGDGNLRLFGGEGYAGTFVWSQAVHYAAAWLDVLGALAVGDPSEGRFSPEVLAETMDLIAITQHVKCSPEGDRSAPTAGMWAHCGPHVLADEIEILQPRAIIVLGTGDSWYAFKQHVAPTDRGSVWRGAGKPWFEHSLRTTARGRGVEVLVATHPAAPGAASRALVTAVHGLLRDRAEADREAT